MNQLNRGIVLVGFMGAGKTTIARELAALLDRKFIDLDEVLVERNGRTIGEMITALGEPAFRELETVAMAETLAANPQAVIALGGGTWTLAENRELVGLNGQVTVWLDTGFDLCWGRILASEIERPLAADRPRARALFEQRREDYSKADVRHCSTEGEMPDEVSRAIVERLGLQPKRN